MFRSLSVAATVCYCALILGVPSAHGQGALAWSDEFDGTTLNLGDWTPMLGNGHAYGVPGWGNGESECYTARPENLFVSGGYLHIIAREEGYSDGYGSYGYTSARLRTMNKQEFLYGRFEARMRLPGGQGIWPAFWMLPTDSPYGGWAASGEIDIMETVGVPWETHGTLIYGGNWPNQVYNGTNRSLGVNLADDFHVYGFEWEEDEMRWYIDGIHFHTVTSAAWFSDAAPGNARAPFDTPFHLLLNIAVGGQWPGYPDETTVFPQEMLVDWVRIYELGNNPPIVSIDMPADGAEFDPATVIIRASASDEDGTVARVDFYVDDVHIGLDTTSPYTTTWAATEGCHTIKAVAVDDLNKTATDSIGVKVGGGCAGIPYHGSPGVIPGVIEAEDFDLGGEGEAYHDCDAINNGGEYRPDDGVDIEEAEEGGYNVGWLCTDEWLNFAVDVAAGGTYAFEARVASDAGGGTFRIEFDGTDVTGDLTAPGTGGWQTWTAVGATVQLEAGVQQMRFVNSGGATSEFNITHFTFTKLEDHDFDQDGDVDLTDWVFFLRCFSGPGSSTPQSTCSAVEFERADVDGDDDVDLIDFAAFQQARTGS